MFEELFHSRGFTVIAGPCAIESREQFLTCAQGVHRHGAAILRGGIFKMRTSPSSFQGLGRDAAPVVAEVRRTVGLPLVSEVTDPRQLEWLDDVVDFFQVGSRNMHNYELLKELGRFRKPVLLKRGLAALLDELLLAAEYVVGAGNPNVVLCERGIRTFERVTRNTLDIAAIPYLKTKTGLPVIVDPSHAAGRRDLIAPLCWAAAAVGADGIMVEVHPQPELALSDGPQALTIEDFGAMMARLKEVLRPFGRSLTEAALPRRTSL